MDRKVFLVRHGHIDSGREKRYIGISDLPLSNAGIGQAIRLKEYFSCTELEKAFTSPLKRCLQTAEILLEGRDISTGVIDGLKEINMGAWENKTIDYIRYNFPEQYEKRGANIDTFLPPGGESFLQLEKRAEQAFEYIVGNTAGNILIVSHAGVIRVILSKLLGFSLKDIFKINQPYGCINRLSWDCTSRNWQWEQVQLNQS